ncbi:MAG: exosortase/archaeosortase family protein [Opitutae bacterium]|nr:exosortase/archaeosortase family protein [Opitutae bacterium]
MIPSVSSAASAPETSERWIAVAIAAMWGAVLVRLSTAWSASVELAHGWAVPVLCALVVWTRRERAPARVALAGGARRLALGAWGAGVAVLLATLPVLEANRLWPTAQWGAAGGAALATLGLLALAGGVAWARHFVFPIFFATTALAWPAFVQTRLLAGLASANAQIAAEAASLAGHPAVARGNVIEVGAGFVDVDEACAGLRSLQAVWMLAWFLGELARLSAARRVGLVAASLLLAFVGNAARATFLTLRVAAEGAGGNERWHDLAGNVAMGATFAAVFAVAWCLARVRPTDGAARVAVRGASASPWLIGATCGAVLAAEIGTRAWFGWHERAAAGAQWELRAASGWTPLALAKSVGVLLRFSSADSLQWSEGGGARRQARAYVFRWENAGSLGTAGVGHEPTVCMPAIGARLVERPAVARVAVAGRELEFARYRFETAGRTQHVFYGVWDAFGGRAVGEAELDISWAARWQRVREGRRRADAAHVVFVWQTENDVSDAAAAAWAREAAERLLRVR